MELKVKVDLKGKLAKELIERPEEFSRKAIWSGLVNLVEEIEARAKKEVPIRTGNLVNSITSTVSPDGERPRSGPRHLMRNSFTGEPGSSGHSRDRSSPQQKRPSSGPGEASGKIGKRNESESVF